MEIAPTMLWSETEDETRLISPFFLDLEGWIDPDIWVLLEQSFGGVLCSRDESIQKDLIVWIVVKIYLSGLKVLELGNSLVILGYIIESKLLFKDFSRVDFEHFLWVILFF